MPKRYKVWVTIEEHEEDLDSYNDVGWPQPLRYFEDMEAAEKWVNHIVQLLADPDVNDEVEHA